MLLCRVGGHSFFKIYFLLKCIEVNYNVLVSGIQQSDSVIHKHIYSFSYYFSL